MAMSRVLSGRIAKYSFKNRWQNWLQIQNDNVVRLGKQQSLLAVYKFKFNRIFKCSE